MGQATAEQLDIYGGRDPKDVAAYSAGEAARYLGMPAATLRSWVLGQPSTIAAGERRHFESVIKIADPDRRLLSFVNLFEAHVLDALRRQHRVPLQRIRTALSNLRKRHPEETHPLAVYQFLTIGLDLLVDELGRLIEVSHADQVVMRELVELYLTRVERDEAGLAARLYPFTRTRRLADDPKVVVIDPRLLFGRPAIAGTRIPTSIIVERWRAGESLPALAEDYGRPQPDIEEAIRCELAQAA